MYSNRELISDFVHTKMTSEKWRTYFFGPINQFPPFVFFPSSLELQKHNLIVESNIVWFSWCQGHWIRNEPRLDLDHQGQKNWNDNGFNFDTNQHIPCNSLEHLKLFHKYSFESKRLLPSTIINFPMSHLLQWTDMQWKEITVKPLM